MRPVGVSPVAPPAVSSVCELDSVTVEGSGVDGGGVDGGGVGGGGGGDCGGGRAAWVGG